MEKGLGIFYFLCVQIRAAVLLSQNQIFAVDTILLTGFCGIADIVMPWILIKISFKNQVTRHLQKTCRKTWEYLLGFDIATQICKYVSKAKELNTTYTEG